MAGLPKQKPQRVFIHYVLGKMILLFFLCHPGTLATCDGQAYLRNRYANRDVVTTESELNEHRRHYRPRDASEFTMKIGVPDEILHGDVDSYTPDWAPSLEERFHNTVKAWLRKGSALAIKQQAAAEAAAAAAATAGMTMAFVPPLTHRAGTTLVAERTADDRLRRRRMLSLDDVGPSPRNAAAAAGAIWNTRLPARTRRAGSCGCGGAAGRGARRNCDGGGGGYGDTTMLLGRFRRGGFPLRRASRETTEIKVDSSSNGATRNDGAGLELQMEAAATAAAAAAAAAAANDKNAARFEDEEALGTARSSSIFSSFLGGAADAYDNAVSFVGSTLIRSEIGKKYMNGYDSGPTSIRRTGGGPADMSTGSTYDLVGFSNIDPFEASGRRGGGPSHRL